MLALTNEMRSAVPIVSKPVALVGALTGMAGVLAAGACLAGFPLEQAVGISIGLGSTVFVAIGAQIMLRAAIGGAAATCETDNSGFKMKNAPARAEAF